LVVGGLDPSSGAVRSDALLWHPSNEESVSATPLLRQLISHAAVLQPDGAVAFFGREGQSPQGFVPSLGRFTPDMPVARGRGREDVAWSEPRDGAASVDLQQRLVLAFAAPLDLARIESDSIRIEANGATQPSTIVIAEGGRLAFITPSGPWQADSEHIVTVEAWNGVTHTPMRAQLRFETIGEAAPELTEAEWTPDTIGSGHGWKMRSGRSRWQALPPLEAPKGQTALAGQLLKLDGRPLPNATIALGPRFTRTDSTGRFLLVLPLDTAGRQVLHVDGDKAHTGVSYGTYAFGVYITPRTTNPLTFTVWMPKIDVRHSTRLTVPLERDIVVTTPKIPGLELHLPAGSVLRGADGRPVDRVSITPIPIDRTPFPLPRNVDVPIFFTVQPGGAYVYAPAHRPARLIYPNYRRAPAGFEMSFWHYEPKQRGWFVYGAGAVARNRRQVVPNAGVGIYEFTGAMVAPPGFGPPVSPPEAPEDGDPVHLSTGLLIERHVDLAVEDILPLVLERTYRTNDDRSRAFGRGATHPYDIFLTGDLNPYTYVDLVLADGRRVHFERTSAGTGYSDAFYEHGAGPTAFSGATIAHFFNQPPLLAGWVLTLRDGTQWRFPEGDFAARPQQAALRSITDRFGNRIDIARNTDGDATTITAPSGRYLQFTYDGAHRVTQVIDNGGRTVGYSYDTDGRLWRVTDLNGGVTEYLYNANHQLTSVRDPRGNVYITVAYNTDGRVVSQQAIDGGSYAFNYTVNTAGEVVRTDFTNSRGHVRRTDFNDDGYLISDTRAVGLPEQRTAVFERAAGTNLVMATVDPLARRTQYGYDPRGNVTEVVALAGTANQVTETFTYDAMTSQVTSVTDALGRVTSVEYSPVTKAILGVTNPAGERLSFESDSAGRLTAFVDATAGRTEISYTGADRTKIVTPGGRVLRRFYDAIGRVRVQVDGSGVSRRLEYNPFGQLTKIEDRRGTVAAFAYDANGNLHSRTDANGNTTVFTYDAMDRLTTATDALGRTNLCAYDAMGNATQVTDAAGQATAVQYDALGRPTLVTYPDASNAALSWDGGNRLLGIADTLAGELTWSYDARDNLRETTSPAGLVSYQYDAIGRRTTMSGAGQSAVTYSYDGADRLIAIQQGARGFAFTYDPAGRLVTTTFASGVTSTRTYDSDARVSSISFASSAGSIGVLNYEYDPSGRVVSQSGSLARLSLPAALSGATYDVANQLTSWNGTAVVNDANGRITNTGSTTYGWDARGSLASISGPTGQLTFGYDALGRRAQRTNATTGLALNYVYDNLNVVEEISAGSQIARQLNEFDPDTMLERTEAGSALTRLEDALGSTIALASDSGTLGTEYAYEAFGKTTVFGGSANAVQFTGRESDAADLYYYRARYYNPVIQRFLSPDPIGPHASDGLNPYSYVNNAPTLATDPMGLGPKKPRNPPNEPSTPEPPKPPFELPDGTGGEKNEWVPIPRRSPDNPWQRWKPKFPVPSPDGKGGQPSSHWDPHDDYWSYDPGRKGGDRKHVPENPSGRRGPAPAGRGWPPLPIPRVPSGWSPGWMLVIPDPCAINYIRCTLPKLPKVV
jgi:RHS repeat-associated protein